MKALVIDKPGTWSVQEVPDPKPEPGEVIVAPKAVGICGTDLHILEGEFPPAPYPLVPGHEFAGEVVEIGAGVKEVSVGDRVAVDPSLFCGHCVYCRRGRGNLCANWGAIGDTVDGAFAQFVRVPEANAYPIPDSMSYTSGALVEPLSCVVHGLHRLAMPAGSDLLIVGGGTIGLLLLQAAVRSGAAEVSVLEPDAARRELALKWGASAAAGSLEELLADRPIGFEFSIEATGIAAAAQAAVEGLCRGGTMLVFGVAPQDVKLPLSQFTVYNDEISVLGSMAVLNSYGPALSLMASGAIAGEDMVTHQFALDDFDAAVDAVRTRQGLKVQVTP